MYSTDICNIALSSIGQGQITSIDEDSEAARQCKLYYELTRKTFFPHSAGASRKDRKNSH